MYHPSSCALSPRAASLLVSLLVTFVALVTPAHHLAAADAEPSSSVISIATAGNSWVVDDLRATRQIIRDDGITRWSDPGVKIRTYFKSDTAGTLNVAFKSRVVDGPATIEVTVGEQSRRVTIESSEWSSVKAGAFELDQPGYHFVEVQGIEKTGERFPEIQNVLLDGEAVAGTVHFVRDEFYWGRRGPSVHLSYKKPPAAEDVVYFYSEILVPEGQDVQGSYFMANGFGEGYFGMQVNSPTERRILFSVWSPHPTDRPEEIPDELKIEMLRKGDGVYTGEFGNEGSGGQSYWRFPWKAGTSYRFLLKGEPTGNGESDFTAWFFAPEVNDWKLIASFRRPKTNSHVTRMHSFLENFITETGDQSRRAEYRNQWAYGSDQKWHELTEARFTADATARKGSRMDYAGGASDGAFYLQNCGFFSNTTPVDSTFQREPQGQPPTIAFDQLP